MVPSDERSRQRRILENQLLLNNLGIHPGLPGQGVTRQLPETSPRMRKRQVQSRPSLDRSGHVITLPTEGQVQHLACVEIPSDRKQSRRIAEGEYRDCTKWAVGEARRQRFGTGRGRELKAGELEQVGGVGSDFRWRMWGGLNRELKREMKRRGELIEKKPGPDPMTNLEASTYSVSPN